MAALISRRTLLYMAKNLERFLVLFPLSLCHMVACMKHESTYWFGALDPDTEKAREMVALIRLATIIFSIFVSAHSSVVLDVSRYHTERLWRAGPCGPCRGAPCVSLTGVEALCLFALRAGEMACRLVTGAWAYFAVEQCLSCTPEIGVCGCWAQRIALASAGAQLLCVLLLTSTPRYWVDLCVHAPGSLWAAKAVVINLHAAQTLANLTGTFFSKGRGAFVGNATSRSAFLGEVRVLGREKREERE
jgi:hypothetical protein